MLERGIQGRGQRLRAALGAVAACLFAACASEPEPRWNELKQEIRARFPGVRQLSSADLERALAKPPAERPLLIDARAPVEFAVSHLAGAVNAEDEAGALRALAGAPKDRPVVVYCSVGYRSSSLAERLTELGFTDVTNHEGSIFEWANSGRPVYRDGEAVRAVHPFDTDWGLLLDRALWPAGFGEAGAVSGAR